MPEQGTPQADLSESIAEIAERSQRLVTEFLSRQGGGANGGSGAGMPATPNHIGSAFLEMTAQMMSNPAKLAEAQMTLWKDYMTLWQSTADRMMGKDGAPAIEPASDDRRFRDDAWSENDIFNFIKQSYLLSANWVQSTVRGVDGLDPKTAEKVDFYTRQLVNAMSPSNFAATNPEVLRATAASGGENLVNGLKNLLGDLERGKGKLSISMTDYDAFEVGVNVATSPGKVIFRNELL
ncbi:MAG: class I poly(R)-hydroxyalkanoic acid synthase, partial [Rhodospirillaceae bacterium]|nr:class I poly(R)-hydroxyalkanoic acid synthase [Rhodospirillaceae bacterium]